MRGERSRFSALTASALLILGLGAGRQVNADPVIADPTKVIVFSWPKGASPDHILFGGSAGTTAVGFNDDFGNFNDVPGAADSRERKSDGYTARVQGEATAFDPKTGTVTVTLTGEVGAPKGGTPAGTAEGSITVDVGGGAKIVSETLDGAKVTSPGFTLNVAPGGGKAKGTDPIHFIALEKATGELIDDDTAVRSISE